MIVGVGKIMPRRSTYVTDIADNQMPFHRALSGAEVLFCNREGLLTVGSLVAANHNDGSTTVEMRYHDVAKPIECCMCSVRFALALGLCLAC